MGLSHGTRPVGPWTRWTRHLHCVRGHPRNAPPRTCFPMWLDLNFIKLHLVLLFLGLGAVLPDDKHDQHQRVGNSIRN